MATYKVLQDIEAEDKLLGPLTLRQFIYAIIVVASGFFMFRLALVNPLLALPLLPHTIFFAVLAAPFGHDQSSEVWLLARIRFFLKPRKRIWDQNGIKELVTITAPKKVEQTLTNGLTQTEVRSRLQALANTIDSRGWAVKNVNVNLYGQPSFDTGGSDRLLGPAQLPQEVTNTEVTATDDILDEQNNPTAQHLDQMIVASSQAHRQQIVSQLHQSVAAQATSTAANPSATVPPDYWFMSQSQGVQLPAGFGTVYPQVVLPSQPAVNQQTNNSDSPIAEEEAALLKELHARGDKTEPAYGHMHTIQPLSAKSQELRAKSQSGQSPKGTDLSTPASQPSAPSSQPSVLSPQPSLPPVTPTSDPAILELANNDDLNVATIARQANRVKEQKSSDNEIVVSLR